jgi:hypothetical protein
MSQGKDPAARAGVAEMPNAPEKPSAPVIRLTMAMSDSIILHRSVPED